MCGMKNGGVATLIITLVVIVLMSFPFCETSWYFWVLYCFMRIFESAYLLHWLFFGSFLNMFSGNNASEELRGNRLVNERVNNVCLRETPQQRAADKMKQAQH